MASDLQALWQISIESHAKHTANFFLIYLNSGSKLKALISVKQKHSAHFKLWVHCIPEPSHVTDRVGHIGVVAQLHLAFWIIYALDYATGSKLALDFSMARSRLSNKDAILLYVV